MAIPTTASQALRDLAHSSAPKGSAEHKFLEQRAAEAMERAVQARHIPRDVGDAGAGAKLIELGNKQAEQRRKRGW